MPESFDVFRIIDRLTGRSVGVYSRAYHDEFEFRSVDAALNANCHGIHKDRARYAIAKYRVVYELIDGDVDH